MMIAQPDTLVFHEERHEYSVAGVVLPSVTQIIHAAFPDPYRFARLEDVEFKRSVGDAVHAATHYFDEGDIDMAQLDPRIHPYLAGYRRFVMEMGYEPIECEVRMHSKRYGYAGTCDKIGVMNNAGRRAGRILVDLKVTATVSPLVPLQTAAYSIMWDEQTDMIARCMISHRCCLHLREDGTYKLVWHDNHHSDKAGFLGCLNRFAWAERAGVSKEEKQ